MNYWMIATVILIFTNVICIGLIAFILSLLAGVLTALRDGK